ncbi:hypothetical protein RJ640_011335, partial [Escallonia rubra]
MKASSAVDVIHSTRHVYAYIEPLNPAERRINGTVLAVQVLREVPVVADEGDDIAVLEEGEDLDLGDELREALLGGHVSALHGGCGAVVEDGLVHEPEAAAADEHGLVEKARPRATPVTFLSRVAHEIEAVPYLLQKQDIVKIERGFESEDGECSIFHKVDWYRVVLDEAHTIKSSRTKGAQAAFKFSSHCRWCLTGTPLQ